MNGLNGWSEWMERMNEQMNGRTNERARGRPRDRASERTNESTNEGTNEQMKNEQMKNERMNFMDCHWNHESVHRPVSLFLSSLKTPSNEIIVFSF